MRMPQEVRLGRDDGVKSHLLQQGVISSQHEYKMNHKNFPRKTPLNDGKYQLVSSYFSDRNSRLKGLSPRTGLN